MSSAQRRRARRRAVRRRRAVALAVIAALVALGVIASTGGGTPPPRATTATRTTSSSTSSSRTSTSTTPSAGSLPQTDVKPGAPSRALMAALWSGVVHDSTRLALPAFFPEGAYAQLKAIADARGDWTGRLVRDFGLDLGAAHALVGHGARLVAVNVVPGYAHWIVPGVCANSIGYWEMPNARVVYRAGGVERSFGIASMISWRGVWYVVHLGSILRPAGTTGYVDDAASGPGVSVYSGTC